MGKSIVKKENLEKAVRKEFAKQGKHLTLEFDVLANKQKILKDGKETEPVLYLEDVYDYYVSNLSRSVIRSLKAPHLAQGLVQIINEKL